MRIKALVTLLGLVLGLGIVGCSDSASTGTTPTIRATVNSSTPTTTVRLFQNTTLIQTVTATSGTEFTLEDITPGSGYTLRATQDSITTIYGPFTVPSSGISGIEFTASSAASLAADDVPTPIPPTNGTALLVAYNTGGATISVDGGIPTESGNPTFTSVTPGTHTIVVSNGTRFSTYTITFVANSVVVIRPLFTTDVTGTTVRATVNSATPGTTVELFQNNTPIRSVNATSGVEFTFTGVPAGGNYTLRATQDSITTIYGPFTVPNTGISGIEFSTPSVATLTDDGVTTPIPPTNGSATLVAYNDGGVTISVDGGAATFDGNPTFTSVTPGTHTVRVSNGTDSVDYTITFIANSVVVIRPVPLFPPASS